MADLRALAHTFVDRATAPFAFCAIGIATGGQTLCHTATVTGVRADKHSVFRAASISKIVTGRVAHTALRDAGFLDAKVEDLLGFGFRNPDGTIPTVAQLASHQAGLTDAGGYAIAAGVTLQDWLTGKGDAVWSGAPAGGQFEYSNLGFVILAACAEVAAGERFDRLADRILFKPRGIAGTFNWSGAAQVASVLSTYRRHLDGQFAAQIDAPPVVATLPDSYVPGTLPGTFSPQGGLRISLNEMVSLGHVLKDHPTHAGWAADPSRTIGPQDLFQDYAWGAQVFHKPAFYPRPLIGHFANAYGFCGGVWWDQARDTVFAYALNGLAIGDEDDGLRPEELAIFEAVSQAA